jgi:hypothetical protein
MPCLDATTELEKTVSSVKGSFQMRVNSDGEHFVITANTLH